MLDEINPIERDKLFNLLHYLKISRASLLIGDDNFEFADLSKDTPEYLFYRSGEKQERHCITQRVNHCPSCGKIIQKTCTEEVDNCIVEDYECSCGFNGNQWFLKLFTTHVEIKI